MQPLFLESSDGIGQMDRLGSPSLSWGSSGFNDGSDSPRVYPRIGDNYQAKVSPFKSEGSVYQLEMSDSMNKKDNWDEDDEPLFMEELSVPVMQIPCFLPRFDVKESQINHENQPSLDNAFTTMEPSSTEPNKMDDGLSQEDLFELADKGCNHELNFIDTAQFTEDNVNSSITDMKTEVLRADTACTDTIVAIDNVPESRGQHRKRGKVGWKRVKKIKFELLKQSSDFNWQTQHTELFNAREDASSRGFIIVPGSPSAPWSKREEDVFILGLYIFGKNLTAVKRFVETKEMGDILSYYYGKFFRTEAYCRWAESRNTRSRKCVQGQRIFSGWRQQELLTRLLPHIPEHLKHEVPKVTKAFNEGTISMEEFVMKIKALAGLDTFVQAVGIGKGKQDLTAALMEPAKTNQVTSARSEIPMGSACSSLSTEEIVKFLTGDFRLSKARANDLFWEAVWPRLLARGWNSEQPEDQALFGFRQSLVFLIPGIKKFSRRKLIKGIHYFDSVSEVLSRVASDPRLLELEMDEITGNIVKPECLWATEVMEEQNGHPGHPHCYLRPRFPTNYFDSFIFTVVDTSLSSQGEQPVRIRESRTLPADDDSDMLQSESGELEEEDNLVSQLDGQDNVCNHSAVGDSLNDDAEESSHIVITNENLSENGIIGMCKASSHDQWDYPCSPLKQRRLSICNCHQGGTLDCSLIASSDSKGEGVMLKNDPTKDIPEAFLDASPLEVSISIPSSVQASPEKRSRATLLSRGWFSANRINNSQNSGPCTLTPETGLSLSLPPEKPDRAMINTIPVACSELLGARKSEEHSQSVENSYSEEDSGHPQEQPNDSGVAQSSIPSPDESQCTGILENNADALPENVRRQSTRTRPLTTRVLEAFACGFFTTRRQRKTGKKTSNPESSHTKSISRLVQDDLTRSHNTCSSDSNDINMVDTSMESMHGDSNSDARLGSKSRLVSKRKR